MPMSTDSESARIALDAVSRTRAELARGFGKCPPWRHAIFGLVFAVLIGSIAVSSAMQIAGSGLVIIAVLAIKRSDEKRMGVFINGYRKGRTLPVTLGFVGVMIVLVVAAMHMRNHGFSDFSKAGLAAIAFAVAVAFSMVWQAVFRRELNDEAAS